LRGAELLRKIIIVWIAIIANKGDRSSPPIGPNIFLYGDSIESAIFSTKVLKGL